jgi:hypothetical protein
MTFMRLPKPLGSWSGLGVGNWRSGFAEGSDSKDVARPFELITPDRLQIREGGGCMGAFGLIFFAAGVFMLLVVGGIVPVSNADEMATLGWVVLLLMGVVFWAVGGTLAFGRSWTTLDITQRIVIKQWGLLMPFRERTHALAGYAAVTLGFVEGDSDSADRFPVGLKARVGANLPLCSFTTYETSRECAVAIARHLKLDVEDATTDHHVRVSPGEADRPIRQRPFDSAREETIPRPASARSEVSREDGGVRIVIPRPPMHPFAVAAGLLPMVVFVVLVSWLLDFFRRTRTPDPIGWVFIGWLAFMFGFLPGMTILNGFLRSRRGGTIVHVSRRGIDIKERGAWKTRATAAIEVSDILDVDYSTRESAATSARVAAEQEGMRSTGQDAAAIGPQTQRLTAWLTQFAKGRGLTVKTRTGLTTFGAGLEDDEIRYLHSIVRRALHGFV